MSRLVFCCLIALGLAFVSVAQEIETFEPSRSRLAGAYLGLVLNQIGVLIIPSLIVIFWRSRPRRALFGGALLIFLLLFIRGVIKTFQAATLFGHQHMTQGIFESLLIGLLGLLIYGTVLIGVQWAARRIFKKKTKPDSDTLSEP